VFFFLNETYHGIHHHQTTIEENISRWWFQIYLLFFTPTCLDSHFSNGLKVETTNYTSVFLFPSILKQIQEVGINV